MKTFKLRTITVKDLQVTGEVVMERLDEAPLILKVGELNAGKTKYYHFHVHRESTVEILYETKDKLQIVKIQFNLQENRMSINSFEWVEQANRYEETAIQKELIESPSFQSILQSISFSGNEQQSYLFHTLRK
jgi:hypothetical protein